jgi:hypothetical protein
VGYERTAGAWGGALVAWATAWVIGGAVLGFEIWQLTGLAQTTVSSGRQLSQAGQRLESLSGTPLVGDAVAEVGEQIGATGAGLIENGDRADQSIRAISLLVGLAVAVVPTASAVAVYLPIRRAQRRDQAAVRSHVEREGLTPDLEAVLARRAAATLPISVLLSQSSGHGLRLAEGDVRALARAELARMGISISEPE